MAFVAFDALGAVTPHGAAPGHAPAAGAHRFSPLEWAVVVLARRDPLTSLDEPGRLSMALGNLFARKANPRLADPRLEALRRIAVLSWHDRISASAHELAAFLAAGFTHGHYETLRASIRAAAFNKAQRA